MALYKIALSAGHFLGTAGKNIPKELDANQTKEWVLNNRIADKVEALLQGYTGYELLRLDDTTGKKNISLTARTNAANNWGATEYYSIHHNANKGKPWSGGGIVIYVYNKASAAGSPPITARPGARDADRLMEMDTGKGVYVRRGKQDLDGGVRHDNQNRTFPYR